MKKLKGKLKLNIQAPARAVGITNASQLCKAVDCSTETAYGLWNETATMLKLSTLARLKVVLKVGVEVLIVEPNGRKRS